MPNDSASVCGCGVPLEFSTSHHTSDITTATARTIIPKSAKNHRTGSRVSTKPFSDTRGGCCSSSHQTTEQMSRFGKTSNTKADRKNVIVGIRALSADRSNSHYTYIDSRSSTMNDLSAVQDTLYTTIPDDVPNIRANYTAVDNDNMRSSRISPYSINSIPSMTSPPPTYDVATATKSGQSGLSNGLPPSYEDYLCHKYEMLSRSHTPPPSFSDSIGSPVELAQLPTSPSPAQIRVFMAELRRVDTTTSETNSHRALRKHVRQQRLRAMAPRSLSETRAHQQRVQTMCEDGAFCMETTAIQSAFENGVAFCSLM